MEFSVGKEVFEKKSLPTHVSSMDWKENPNAELVII